MPPDDRTYIKLHDGMPDHPKIDPLSDAAFRLLIAGWCWCSRHLTDGHMPLPTWAKRGTAKARAELIDAGLVIVGSDVEFRDYLEHQRSAAQVAAIKEQRREAGRRGGLAKGKRVAKQTASNSSSKDVAETETDTEDTSNEVSGGRTRRRATRAPDLFPLSDDLRAWGREHCPHVADPFAETQQFLDYHRAKGSTFKDWSSAWRTWMRNAEKYANERAARFPTGDSAEEEPWWMRRGGASA